MDPIKEAFAKAKQDIFNLQSQIESLKNEVSSINNLMKTSSLNTINPPQFQQTDKPTNRQESPSNPLEILPNTPQIPTFQHTHSTKTPQYSPITANNPTSIGNRGVPTDRQTNQQTDRHTGSEGVPEALKLGKEDRISHLERVSEVLSSLDSIKKDLRQRFKHLTNQEMAVFSNIYGLENQGFIVDYSLLAQKLSLSESSIRDYIQKIIKKGIPLTKTKENNKKIILSIAQELKKIASLETISMLREL